MERSRGRPRKQLKTLASVLAEKLERRLAERSTIQWPSPKYRQDILGFCRDILGISPWSRQQEVLLAIQDNRKIAVRAGRRVSKSNTVAIAALWHYCSFPDSKVAITGPGSDTVSNVLWDEIKRLYYRSGICCGCRATGIVDGVCPHSAKIDGEISPAFRHGLRAKGRKVYGFSVKKAGAARGIAAPNLFLIADEAAEIDDSIFEVMMGNAASSQSTRTLITGNPSKITGFFFEAFHSRAHLWKTLHIRSRESPNVTGECERIDGLADPEWIQDYAATYGDKSPQFLVDIEGEFSSLAESRPFTEEALRDSTDRWAAQPAKGRLHIGIDVAGPKGTGDATKMAVRRGFKILPIADLRGSDEIEILERCLEAIKEHRAGDYEIPVVVLDAEAAIGANVRRTFEAHLSSHPKAFELVPFRGSEPAVRDGRAFATRRDELYFNFSQWFAMGGCLPSDEQLKEELRHFLWVEGRGKNKTRAIPKIHWQRQIKRSPDSADAAALCCYQSPNTAFDAEQTPKVVYGPNHFQPPWARPQQPTMDRDWRQQQSPWGAIEDRDWRSG